MSFSISRSEIIDLSIEEYFKKFINASYQDTTVEELTQLFTDSEYTDPKPYLYRRQLKPVDSRFKKIEIVYDNDKTIDSIVLDFDIKLNELERMLDKPPQLHYTPHGGATFFGFFIDNSDIKLVNSSLPGKIKERKLFTGYKRIDDDGKEDILINPTLSYIKLDLKLP